MKEMVLKGLLSKAGSELLTHEEQAVLHSAIVSEVDLAAAYAAELAEREAKLREQARAICVAAKAAEKQRERFMGYIQAAMQKNGYERLPGQRYEAVLKPASKPRVIVSAEPTEQEADAYPALVRVTYEWNLDRLRALMEMGSTVKWATLERSSKVIFKEVERV